MDCIVHGEAKSQKQLSDFHFQFLSANKQNINISKWLKKLPLKT